MSLVYLEKLPKVQSCFCVSDLQAASAIIASLGFVFSPAVCWAIVRHSFAMRVTCFKQSMGIGDIDVFDINYNKIGFGGPTDIKAVDKYTRIIRSIGWSVLAIDILLAIVSMVFLFTMFKGNDKMTSLIFMIVALFSLIFCSISALWYIAIVTHMGGSFPGYELFIILLVMALWIYFLFVVNTYRMSEHQNSRSAGNQTET